MRCSEARGDWYYLIQSVPAQPPGAPVMQIFGSYADKYQRTASGWRIKESVAGFFIPPT
jgi:hypothetical protein